MKRLFTVLAAVLLSATTWAQSPQKMSYQAVIRNTGDQLVTNHAVGMQISILQGSVSGTVVYTETQTPTTNANGLVSIEIGGGTGFDAINWANGPYFIKTETDPTGGTNFTAIVGTSSLLSVPYALYAKTGENVTGTVAIGNGGTGATTVTGAKTSLGLSNVDNTPDLLKPISTATQTALDLKAPLASPTFTGTVSGITKSMVGLDNVDNTADLLKPISTPTQTALDLKAPLASPTFTGTVSGITKSMVGLDNVDNTADLLKPISTPTQTALDLKAPLASPTFTGTVSGITKSMVGLDNVDNTADLLKPISTPTQTALDLKAPLASPIFTGSVKLGADGPLLTGKNGMLGIGTDQPSTLLDLHIADDFSSPGLNISMPDWDNQTMNHQAFTISSAWAAEGIARTNIFSLYDEESSPVMELRRLGYNYHTSLVPGGLYLSGENGNNITMNWEEGFQYGTSTSGYNIQINTEFPFLYRTYSGTWTDRARINSSGNAFFAGNMQVNGTIQGTVIKLSTGAANGNILTSDASGNASWQPPNVTVPVGGVVAWLKSLPNTPALTANFVECNGQTLDDPESPYNGATIPNLNASLFLMGKSESGTTGGSVAHSHTLSISPPTSAPAVVGSMGAASAASPNHSHSGTAISADSRPPYYTVVWIMRVK